MCAQIAAGLQEIATKSRQVDELVGEIATASSEQTQGIEQVNVAVSQMDIVVQASAARADDGASLAQELTAQAASLQQNIGELVLLIGGKTSQQSTPADILESETQVIPPAHVGKHQLPAATNR